MYSSVITNYSNLAKRNTELQNYYSASVIKNTVNTVTNFTA